jgi:Xaa-Pro aminopeptidase
MPPTAEFLPIAAYKPRLKALRAALAKADHPALLITNPTDIRYLSPFCGDDSYALITASKFIIISDSRYEGDLKPVKGLATVFLREGDMIDAVQTVVGDSRLKRLAVQSDHLTVHNRKRIATAIKATKLIDTTGIIAAQRVIKDDHEIAFIRRAVAIQQAALLATLKTIKPGGGQTELEIAARLEFEMKSRGSVKPAFDTIVAADANSAKPHATPGPLKTKRNGVVLVDWGARSGGYCSDMTRVFALGAWPKKVAEIYSVVLEAHQAAMAAGRPGMTAQALDAVARNVIEKAGFGKLFGHGTGHGIGLNIHESPSVRRLLPTTVLEPGMVVTIEPGIYLPGIGGVRIEDDLLITKRGSEGLCTLPKTLDWATL